MTAQPAGPKPVAQPWVPDVARMRRADYTVEDVLGFPDDAPRVELRDGELIVVPSPSLGHQDIGNLLWAWLRQHAPREFKAGTAVGVEVNSRNTFEPDVVLLRAPAVASHHYFAAEQVALVVEVVSPGTKRRDRFEKPTSYALAGVAHYWRIEQDPVHVFAYDLAADGTYELVADSDTELVLTRPFEIRLPIAVLSD
jgi:Uma2 family endonuclease